MRGGADRVDDAWQLSDGSAALRADLEDDGAMELGLLAYAQRSAARVGAEWFAAEFARRDAEEQRQREVAERWQPPTVASESTAPADPGLVDASVEDNLIGGAPAGLGIASPTPPPTTRHPHVPRPPALEPEPEPKRRRRGKQPTQTPTPSPAISAPEWARMSPGARRLYGVDEPPRSTGAR
jgi:hypothetical protein